MKKDLLLLMLCILPSFALLLQRGYFPMHDDLQVMRQLQMDKCFRDRQLPCRWSADLGYGFGYPLFNFYPPLPYYLGQLFRYMGLAYIDVVKAMGVVGFIITAFSMYFLGREFWGRRGGLLSSLFYTYAPYHAVDYYVRGAVNEFWAMGFYPAIFYTSYKLIRDSSQKKYIVFLSLSFAGLLLSHNPMLMIFAPFLVLWCVYWMVKMKIYLPAGRALFISGLWSLGLAAFFTLPVLFEKKYAHVETLVIGYFNYLAHFLDLKQIFWRVNWGYGESVYGPADTMSFFLGYLHWIIPLIVLIYFFSKKLSGFKSSILLLTSFILVSLFMSHFKATPLWMKFKPLEFLQFPWRFLTLAVFFTSFLSGAIALVLNKRLYSVLIVILILINANFFRPRAWFPDTTDADKFSGKSWQLLVTASIFDYLPVWAPLPPPDPAGSDINILEGKAEVTRLEKRSHRQRYAVSVASQAAVIELQTFYFPGWRIWVDGKEMTIDPTRDKFLGRMRVDLPAGGHDVLARFTDTPVRLVGNLVSLASWIGLALYIIIPFRRLLIDSG